MQSSGLLTSYCDLKYLCYCDLINFTSYYEGKSVLHNFQFNEITVVTILSLLSKLIVM
jgi:hypothetical protein